MLSISSKIFIDFKAQFVRIRKRIKGGYFKQRIY